MRLNSLYTFIFMTLLSSALLACSGNDDTENIGSGAAVSECGGFANAQARIISDENSLGDLNCGSETIKWSYDSGSDQVNLLNNFVALNCCGDHSIKAVYNESSDVYEIKEKDAPVNGDERCLCMCTFDFTIDIPAFGTEKINLLLTREVTDSDGGETEIYRGELDLSESSGEIVIKENVGYCE